MTIAPAGLAADLRGVPRRGLRREDGNVTLTFALAFPVLLGVMGLAVDSAAFYDQQARMQTVADSTALSVAKELHLFLNDSAALKAAGESRAEALLAESGIADRPHMVEVRLDPAQGYAQVEIAMAAEAFLPAEIWGENPIVVRADARSFGQVSLCILGLEEHAGDTIRADHGALVTALDCAIQSNSTDADGMRASATSVFLSAFICSSGGYDGLPTSFLPLPQTDCPIIDDPLDLRAPPPVGGCDFLDFRVDDGDDTIGPGTYCGGLEIVGDADVAAEPGIYLITGGPLKVSNDAKLRGEHVAFYFDDDAAIIDITDRAVIELSAPQEGSMAGILFFENPAAPEGRDFKISSNAARKLLGTIYLPKGTFKGGAGGLIGSLSAYTIIVANRIDLDGAQLVINADYAASDIPVPLGLGPNSTSVRLSN